jgi:hypothetical protein
MAVRNLIALRSCDMDFARKTLQETLDYIDRETSEAGGRRFRPVLSNEGYLRGHSMFDIRHAVKHLNEDGDKPRAEAAEILRCLLDDIIREDEFAGLGVVKRSKKVRAIHDRIKLDLTVVLESLTEEEKRQAELFDYAD